MARVRYLERADLAPEHQQHRISDATFEAVQHRLGDAGVIDLLMLIGYYYSLARTLGALEVGPPLEVPSTLSR